MIVWGRFRYDRWNPKGSKQPRAGSKLWCALGQERKLWLLINDWLGEEILLL